MIAYDYYCKQRLLEWKQQQKLKFRFTEDDILDALELIYNAMEMAEDIIDEGEAEHFDIFIGQLIDWGFDPLALPPEPYLDEVKLNFTYQFTKMMDTLFIRVESYLHDLRGTAKKTGISFYSGDSMEMQSIDTGMEWKAFTSKEPLVDQVNSRIMLEARRTQNRLQRNLDARRQREAGVLAYIWRSSDDDKVRHSHSEYDDRIFSWDNPPPGGHPGQAYGCRCRAEPLPPGVPASPEMQLPPMSDEEMRRHVRDLGLALATLGIGKAYRGVNAVLRGIQAMGREAGIRLARYRDDRLFRRPQGVPQNWVRRPVNKGEGVIFEKPGTNGTTFVKIQKARPESNQPGQRFDSIRLTKNGKSLDVNGNIVPKQSFESHIPVKDFKFKPELFR